jgi:starch phosphorylase
VTKRFASSVGALGSSLPTEIDGIGSLMELALDVRWSWNHAADEIWKHLDPEFWELTHSPWGVLQSVSHSHIERVLAEPAFREKVERILGARKSAAQSAAWFQQAHSSSALNNVAYFSMEFMLSEALPIYSGGLGNVAGDQLKAAGDLGVPVVGVGLLYSQGYFRQVIDRQGAQQAIYPYNDPGQLPITPLRRPDGEWLRFRLDLPGHAIWLRTWQVRVGRLNLYLLDSNDAANYPPYRGITGELYGGDPEMRLQQELVLGIGGWRLLDLLGVNAEVCHLNEGHAAFAVLERARCFMRDTGQPFEVALTATRAGNLFTTHTAVAAGFDRFEPQLIERYLGDYAESTLAISPRALLALGRLNPDDPAEAFSMANLALRGSGAVNGVSRLHGEVSRRIFAPQFPRWPLHEVPVGHVTNGVHVPSWDSAHADALWTENCGKERWVRPAEEMLRNIRHATDGELWSFRNAARADLVNYARSRLSQELTASGAVPASIRIAEDVLDPNILTIGFARRFATYKRPDLLLHDRERLLRLLTDPHRPIQLIIAGKAHPADAAGQSLIVKWTHFIRATEARLRAVFLADYDMLLTERLVQGVDLWLNTPRRPWEASGTSGMKVLVNGGINLSELDGWWAEAYNAEVGWALGDGLEHGEDPSWDAKEADALYSLLEQEIVPQFYSRDPDGVPAAWVARMRHSMAQLTPQYSSARTVREYVERHYVPAARSYRDRAARHCAEAIKIAAWRRALERQWPDVWLGEPEIRTAAGQHRFEIPVQLGALDVDAVRVELYAEGLDGAVAERHRAIHVRELADRAGGHVYTVAVPAARPATDYTPRVLPNFNGVAVPLEANQIAWQH